MHRSALMLLVVVSGIAAEESGRTITYDATYANWLSQSWEVAGGTPTKGHLVSAGQDIEPGVINRISYRNVESVGLKPFATVAFGSDSQYTQLLGGLDYTFENGLMIGTQFEYGTSDAHTWTLDDTGTKTNYDGESRYMSALVSVGSETWGAYIVSRQNVTPNMLTVREVSSGNASPQNPILDMYYDKDYSVTTANLGLYLNLGFDCGPGTINVCTNLGVGPAYGKIGSEAKKQIDADWGDPTGSKARWGFDAALDVGYEQRIFGAGILGFGVRGVAFGNIDAIDSGSGSHGGSGAVGSDYTWDLVSSRVDGFVGPYLRVGAVF